MPSNDDIAVISGATNPSSSSEVVTDLINANRLTSVDEPANTLSFMMVDRNTNEGFIIDYNKLCNIIWDKVIADSMPDDGLKFYVVD